MRGLRDEPGTGACADSRRVSRRLCAEALHTCCQKCFKEQQSSFCLQYGHKQVQGPAPPFPRSVPPLGPGTWAAPCPPGGKGMGRLPYLHPRGDTWSLPRPPLTGSPTPPWDPDPSGVERVPKPPLVALCSCSQHRDPREPACVPRCRPGDKQFLNKGAYLCSGPCLQSSVPSKLTRLLSD